MQNLIHGLEQLPPGPFRRLEPQQQLFDIDVCSRYRRQDRMVQVEFDAMLRMVQRRQLVTPVAVVPLIVLVQKELLPSCSHQQGLRLRHVRGRHHDVDVGRQAPLCDRKILRNVRGTLQQDLWVGFLGERRADAIDDPDQGLRASARKLTFSAQVPSRFGGYAFDQSGFLDRGREAREQPKTPRQPHHVLPFREIPGRRHRGLAQRTQPGQLSDHRCHAEGSGARAAVTPCCESTDDQRRSRVAIASARSL